MKSLKLRILSVASMLMLSVSALFAQSGSIDASLNGSIFPSQELASFGTVEFVVSITKPLNGGIPGTVLDPGTVWITMGMPSEVNLGTPVVKQQPSGFPPGPAIISNTWSFTSDGTASGGYFENTSPIVIGNPTGVFVFEIPYTVSGPITVPLGNADNYIVAIQMPTGIDNIAGVTEIAGIIEATNISLPVTFNHFVASAKGCTAALDFKIEKESNVLGYAVQRSANGKSFETIGEIAFDSKSGGQYQFVDEDPIDGTGVYRIKAIGTDGGFALSMVQKVNIDCNASNIEMFPNPTQAEVTLSGLSTGNRILVYDLTGRMLLNQKAVGTEAKFDLSNYPAAIYRVVVTSFEGNVIYTNKVSKQ